MVLLEFLDPEDLADLEDPLMAQGDELLHAHLRRGVKIIRPRTAHVRLQRLDIRVGRRRPHEGGRLHLHIAPAVEELPCGPERYVPFPDHVRSGIAHRPAYYHNVFLFVSMSMYLLSVGQRHVQNRDLRRPAPVVRLRRTYSTAPLNDPRRASKSHRF